MKYSKDLWRLIGLMGNKKWVYLISLILCAAIQPIYQIGYAFVYMKIINAVEFSNSSMLISGIVLMLGIMLIYCVVQPITAYYYEGRLYYPITDLHIDIVKNILKYSNSYFDKNHSGNVMSRLTNDLEQLSVFYREYSYDIISQMILGVGSLLSVIVLDIRFIPLMLALGFLSLKLNHLFVYNSYKLNILIQEGIGRINEWFCDLISGFQTMKVLGSEKEIYRYFNKECDDVLNAGIAYGKMQGKKNGLNYFLSIANYFIILVVGIFMINKGYSDLGTVIALSTLQAGVASFFIEIGSVVSNFQKSIVGAKRIFELIDAPKEIDGECEITKETDSLEFSKVMFSYSDEGDNALNGVNMTFLLGKMYTIVGESGSGKSTIFKILLGLYQGYNGSINLYGNELSQCKLADIRNVIGYVPQEAYMFNGTIKENIRMARLDATDEEVIEAAKMVDAHSFILETENGYDTVLGDNGINLSGGQYQRIELARVLLKRASIILLDEATSALDIVVENNIKEVLRQILSNKIVIMISHRLNLAKDSDFIYVMDNGTVVEAGSHGDLIKNQGCYFRLYNTVE